MESATLSCPQCQVALRIRDRALIGRTFDCPECRQPLTLVDGSDAGLAVKRVERLPQPATSKPSDARAPVATKPSLRTERPSTAPSRMFWEVRGNQLARFAKRCSSKLAVFRDPLVMVWTSAFAFAIVMLLVLKPWSGGAASTRPVSNDKPVVVVPEGPGPPLPAPEKVDRPAENKPQAAIAPPEDAAPQLQLPPAPKQPSDERGIARNPVEAVRPADAVAVPAPPAAPVPALDPKAALDQPIARYDQTVAVALSDLLLELEELAAIPIHYDATRIDGLPERLQKRISFTIESTTVGEILRTALKQAELDYDVRPDGIHLRPSADAKVPKDDKGDQKPAE